MCSIFMDLKSPLPFALPNLTIASMLVDDIVCQ